MTLWTCITDDDKGVAVAAASHSDIAIRKEGRDDYVLTLPEDATDMHVTALQMAESNACHRLEVDSSGLRANQVRIHCDVPLRAGHPRTITVLASPALVSAGKRRQTRLVS